MQKILEKPVDIASDFPFKSHRSLTTLDEYACRYKLSKVTIEEFRKMGILQTRKFKGQTFIIDTPTITYPEDVTDLENNTPAPQYQLPLSLKDRIIALGKTDIKDIPAYIMACWKTIVVSSLCLFALIFSLSSYTSKQYDIESLSQANVGLRTALNNAMLHNQQSLDVQVQMDTAKATIAQLQDQLSQARSQLDAVQKQLNFANQRLDFLNQRNSHAQKQFDLQNNSILNRHTNP